LFTTTIAETIMTYRPTIAFDLDGTLVDTAPDLVATLNVVLDEFGLKRVPFNEARNIVGGGARALLERGLALEGIQPAPAEFDRMLARFLSHYETHLADHSLSFPGASETLDTLAASGAILVICTNKLERFSAKLLKALGLADRFAFIAGPDTFSIRKPDPGHLLGAVSRAGGHYSAAIMVGDSITDVATARAAKVPVIAVSFGYSDVPAHRLGADRVVDQLTDIPAVVATLLSQ
jgi:phosphoglycolate phosphatase